jgi:7-cyano-7-deazaguanine reductase
MLHNPGSTDYPTLTLLGNKVTEPQRVLEHFTNPAPGRYYQVTLSTQEFTSKCPITSQPDFGSIEVIYFPFEKVIESKSWKLFLSTFREEGVFAETLINWIADFIMENTQPYRVVVVGSFTPRGGIAISVRAERDKKEVDESTPW